jgi:hypothetical protein
MLSVNSQTPAITSTTQRPDACPNPISGFADHRWLPRLVTLQVDAERHARIAEAEPVEFGGHPNAITSERGTSPTDGTANSRRLQGSRR